MDPVRELGDTTALHLAFLDKYRSVIERKLSGLSDTDLRTSRLPSGWTPLELLKHLVHMERRWLRWGFAGEPVEDPWADSGSDPDAPWRVGQHETLADLLALLRAGADSTRALVTGTDLHARGAVGGRFTAGEQPTLNWILFHVLEEYARHAGHLDIAVELADGATGE